MTIDSSVEAEIRRLHYAEHWKRGTIAAQLGVHPDVLERVLSRPGPRPKVERRAQVLAPYHAFIDETLARYPRLVATRIGDMIRARGYKGGMSTLRAYVRGARPTPKVHVYLRLETFAGEQAQVDWAHVGTMAVPGGARPLWAFVIVLGHSRAMWAELVMEMDIHSLRRSLVRASSFFGGSPRQWLFDNAKTVVIERAGDAIRFHPALLDLAGQMHVQPRLCAPRQPQEKGKVERAIRFLKDRFFPGRTFHSLAHGNAHLLQFLAEVANVRRHPRFAERSVAEVFDEEKLALLALPTPSPCIANVTPIVVDKTAFIRLSTNRYSVPSAYARRTLTLVADDITVRLLDGAMCVAEHVRVYGRHQVIERPEHRQALLEHKRQARALKGRDRLHAELPGFDQMMARWVDAGRQVGSMTSRTLMLLDTYGAPILRDALSEMLRRGTHDPGALALLCEQRRRPRQSGPVALPLDLAPHVVERDVIAHDLGDYDDNLF